DGGEECVMSTQEYIKKVLEDVGEDEDFKRGSWVSAIEYVNANGGIMSGCLGDIKNFFKNEKLDQVVAIVKSCTPNMLGDLTVTLKDLSGAALILANVSIFSLKPSMHYIWLRFSVRMQNLKVVVVYVGVEMLNEKEIMKLLEEEEMVYLELQVCGNVTDLEDQYKLDEEALNLALEEEAMVARAEQEWLEKCRKEQELDEEHERQLWGFYV
ncbi:hypothetical protein Tco_1459897, partial [Tanacetum coccineum]